MRHRIYFAGPLTPGQSVMVTGEEMHHAARVARVRPGEAVELLDGKGGAATGIVEDVSGDAVAIRVTGSVPSRESPLDVTLAMSIIQMEKFELVLQKATELGVRTIVPLEADRGEVRAERYRGRGERWERIVLEAVKQCGRSVIPRLASPAPLDAILAGEGEKLFADAGEPASELPSSLSRVTIFIGPEGGWSEREISLAKAASCRVLRLGPRRLRAETAAIVATGIITARYGDI